jgi:hypothetical protein
MLFTLCSSGLNRGKFYLYIIFLFGFVFDECIASPSSNALTFMFIFSDFRFSVLLNAPFPSKQAP